MSPSPLSIQEKLAKLDSDVVEQDLRELAIAIEKTNVRLDRSKILTHETLSLVVNL